MTSRAWIDRPDHIVIFSESPCEGDTVHGQISERQMRDLIPGGYLFIHLVFWTVVSMVAVGTNLMAIVLSLGLGILALESFKKG